MKTKFINSTDSLTTELLDGYVRAFSRQVKLGAENIVVRTQCKDEKKVAIVAFGGSGHEPAVSGFVGKGMLDCSVVGDIFAAPGAQRVYQALEMFKRDAGTLLLVLNHSGDVMSGNMAMQLASRAGIKVASIVTHDDISAGLDAKDEDRRGLAGAVVMYKVLGAAAEAGKSLDEIIAIANRLNDNIATLAVAMGKCTHPQNGAVITELPVGDMQIGMGQHGEAGKNASEPLVSADETAQRMVELLMKKVAVAKEDKVVLYINGVGSTTLMEQFVVYRAAAKVLESAGAVIVDGYAGEMLTVQEQNGFQMILAKVDNEQADLILNHPSDAPYWTRSVQEREKLTKLNVNQFQKMIANACSVITERAEEFSKLDAALGDGDHGEAISTALKVMQTDSNKGTDFKTILGEMGFGVMLQTSGSTSTLLGGFMIGMGDNVMAEAVEIDAAQLKQMFVGGLEGIRKNTNAQIGDKTIIDALEPAVTAMTACNSKDCFEILEAGAKAAMEGAMSTKDMVAAYGRAKNLGEKSKGHVDAGAMSWATMLESFAETLKKEC